MVSGSLPEGMSEVDYEAIEAAVTETVRGRWFLNEFARRNRLAETRLLLDAMARLEATVAANQTTNQVALPSADPSIRLLVQRIKEIAGHLDGLAREMREDGLKDRYWSAVDHQARAVAGLMRGGPPVKPVPLPTENRPTENRPIEARPEVEAPRAVQPPPLKLPRADLPPAFGPRREPLLPPDPRLAALSGLDGLPLAKKVALFS